MSKKSSKKSTLAKEKSIEDLEKIVKRHIAGEYNIAEGSIVINSVKPRKLGKQSTFDMSGYESAGILTRNHFTVQVRAKDGKIMSKRINQLGV